MPKSTLIFQFGSFFVLPGICTCQPRLQTSHRPDGKLPTCLNRLSLAQLRLTIRSTTVGTCRRDLQFSHRPDGRLTLVLLVVCRAAVSMSMAQ
jgi:hypothetical protein